MTSMDASSIRTGKAARYGSDSRVRTRLYDPAEQTLQALQGSVGRVRAVRMSLKARSERTCSIRSFVMSTDMTTCSSTAGGLMSWALNVDD